MEESLDFNTAEFEALLNQSSELVLQQFEGIALKKGFHHKGQSVIEGWFDEPIPNHGMPVDILLKEVDEKIIQTATGNLGANMYGYVMAGGNQVGIIAEKLAATINQNVAKWHLAPAITEIDKRVVQWASEMIGFGKDVGGFLGSSGSSANLDGLTVARNVFFEKYDIRNKGLFGMAPMTVYCSSETHNSVDKSVQLLGIGNNQLRHIAVDNQFKIDLEALEYQIEADISDGCKPFCIIGNAGTVNTGAIDDLKALSTMAKKYGLWLHIDGAYGGLASSLESLKGLYEGIEHADSVALDFHKWLYQPFEVGCLLVKNWSNLKKTYFKQATYLDKSLEVEKGRLEFNEHHFLLSRSAKSLKVWMSIKAYGLTRIKSMIQKDIDLTKYLNNKITDSSDFELVAASDLAISCFRFTNGLKDAAAITALNKQLVPALERDGRVFITSTSLNGTFVLRACFINHRKTKASTDYLLEVIREVGARVV